MLAYAVVAMMLLLARINRRSCRESYQQQQQQQQKRQENLTAEEQWRNKDHKRTATKKDNQDNRLGQRITTYPYTHDLYIIVGFTN